MKLPKHINLTLEHNPHTVNYETVREHFEYHQNEKATSLYDFISEEDKQKCIEQNDFWSCHWYPNTPVGFNCVAGSSLEVLLEYISGDDFK